MARSLQSRALRRVGAGLQKSSGEVFELNGVSVQSAEPKPAAEADGEVVRGANDETTVVGGGCAPDVGETARASARDDDDIRIKLDRLMDFVTSQADESNQIKDVVSGLCSRMGAVDTGAVAGSPTRASQEVAAEAPAAAESSVDQLLRARELSGTVMGALRGKPPPDDPSLSPIKRLDAQHAGSAVDYASSSSARFWQLHLWVANSAYGLFPLRIVLSVYQH